MCSVKLSMSCSCGLQTASQSVVQVLECIAGLLRPLLHPPLVGELSLHQRCVSREQTDQGPISESGFSKPLLICCDFRETLKVFGFREQVLHNSVSGPGLTYSFK